MAMRWPSMTIRTTVLTAIVASVLVPSVALWALERSLTRHQYEPVVAQSRQAALVLAGAELVEPMWSIHEAQLQAVARRILDDPAVVALRITEKRPDTKPLELSKPDARREEGVRLATPISREGEQLGELEMWFDARQVDLLLAERGRATAVLAAVQVLAAALLLLAVLGRRLVSPIERLKQQASDIASSAPMAPLRWHRDDELGELGRHLDQVHAQIRGLFGRLADQNAELERLAMHDALTGLPNRTLFRELARAAIASAQRDGQRLALLFIDLDRFKAINDTLGHGAGDAVLTELSARLRQTLRASDLLCRHSGDEFIVMVRDAGSEDAIAATADRLLSRLEEPMPVRGRDVTVSASIGIAVFPDDAAEPEDLIRLADTAMYAAKNMGRARHSFYRAEYSVQLQAALNLERELRAALEGGQFMLHYQPQVDAVSGALLGCEALIRWRHPQRGLVPPGDFIASAEQSGVIDELGSWTIRSACAQIARWKAAGVAFGKVAVNVSAIEFRHHRLVDTLTAALHEWGVEPHELELEITESVLMTDTQTTQRIVERLQALGLSLAVDDFGTGYSSLAYLKHLRPSKIKIDRSFVRDVTTDEDDRVLVQAIVQLARALEITVVAEGVETAAQRDYLRAIGCDALQGYLISRPAGAEEFERLVAATEPSTLTPATA
jgi:diguanylate cyclase (GGDEF)-like protein